MSELIDIEVDKEPAVFTQPDMTSGSIAYLPTTGAVPPSRGGDDYAERTVTTSDGVRLHLHDYGSAAVAEHTVVLLHGLSLSQEVWEAEVRELLNRWGTAVRVITYDHRGHGQSTGAPMDSYRVDRLAADLAEVLIALRVRGPLTLAGHSMGGMTALAYFGRPAADRPVEPQGLVLIATAAGRLSERGLGRLLASPATKVLFELVHHMPRRVTDRAIKGILRPVRNMVTRFSGPGDSDQGAIALVATAAMRSISLTTLAGFLNSLKQYDQYETLTSIAAKTVVISGGGDLVTPASHARDMVEAIPGATHLHRPTAGHMLLQDAPDCVRAAINSAMGLRGRSTDKPRRVATAS